MTKKKNLNSHCDGTVAKKYLHYDKLEEGLLRSLIIAGPLIRCLYLFLHLYSQLQWYEQKIERNQTNISFLRTFSTARTAAAPNRFSHMRGGVAVKVI